MKQRKWVLIIVPLAVAGVLVTKYVNQKPEQALKPNGVRVRSPQRVLAGPDLTDALKSGRPTVADFGKGWCRPCKMMVPVLKQAARELAGKANVVYVDMEKYPKLAEQHRISIMPTQIFFDTDGKEVTRHIGFMALTDIKDQLQ